MFRRLIVAAVAALAALVVLAPAAAAHVTVTPGEATRGGFATLGFQVPNERDDAGTVRLEVAFPEDHPLAFVSVRPQPGWTIDVETAELAEPVDAEGTEMTEAVSRIVWEGGPINPGEFQVFQVSVGPLPTDADQLVFPTIQTYSSGEEVRWIEVSEEGGEEPERPAPVLTLVDPVEGADDHGGGGGEAEEGGTEDGESAAPEGVDVENLATSDDVDSATNRATMAMVISIIAAVAGLGALAVVLSRRRA
jgi:uncharacterized protein YcnI